MSDTQHLKRAVQRHAHELLDRKIETARNATTLEAALDGVDLRVPVPRDLFAAHATFFVIVDAEGFPLSVATREADQPTSLTLFSDEASARNYDDILHVDGTALRGPLTGEAVLALATEHGVDVFALNAFGPGPSCRLSPTTDFR